MNKTILTNVLQRVAVLLIAVTLLCSAVVAPHAQASDFKASYIEKQEDLKVNIDDYLDKSVMFELPETVKDDDDISIIVTLDIVPLLDEYEKTDKKVSFAEFALKSEKATEIREKIGTEKAGILDALDQLAIRYTTGENYTTLLSGFEIVIKARDFKEVCKSVGNKADVIVGEVYNVAATQLVDNNVNVYDTGIFNSSNVDFDGSGMVVAVLDTGVDYAHSAFNTANFHPSSLGLTYDNVAALLDKTVASNLFHGLAADDVYISEKIPFGFDYADNDSDPYSTHNSHGTHVSGIIVGKDDTITGVAPNAQLVSMKVFSDIVDTARSAWILSALEDCVVLGVDVINMSLGTSCGFGRPSDEEKINGVYDKIREAGISLVVAASNSYSSAFGSTANGNLGLTSNPDTATVGSPGTYDSALSVASINGAKTPYVLHGENIIYFNETHNSSMLENNFVKTLLGDETSKEMDYVVIPGVGRSADYTGLDVKGKIVLVRRGANTFEEKSIIAQNAGAAGIIIYNNVSGDIKMNVADATLATCSISQEDGEALAAAGNGKLKLSVEQASGPFMSDFSSWGPTPSLGIKPEITAHGGNILSSVTGGSYDRISGTSMACPNVAGVTLLLRQYVVENFPEIADNNQEVNAMVNRLMMSTADIVINQNGLPYAVRKQGAGLVNLANCVNSNAVISTYDTDGKIMGKTKLELGDDPDKTGVYEMSFNVENFGDASLSYDISAIVMTEGVSDILTSTGNTTVTESGRVLEGAVLEVVSVTNGTLNGKNVTVAAGQDAKVTVKITLSDADKQFMNESFKNGMYVEGFIKLTATAGTSINMSVPYLAFYGDWNKAPLFDRDYFETDADERDESLAPEDKVLPDAFSTRPVGGIQGDFVSYLGSYYFMQDPDDMVISANRDYVALSNQDGTVHSLKFVWAGLLRNAAKVEISITDDATGEVIYQCVDDDVRKSYSDGSPTIRPANVEIDFDTMDYNLKNNSRYTVKLVGYVDYGDGGLQTNEKNTFEFPLVIDFQAPVVEDVEFYYEYDKTLKKNRLYAKAAVYDNHFAMAAQLGYVTEDDEGNVQMKNLEHYMTPIYSKCDSTTYVTYELTDFINEIKNNSYNKNSFVLTCYDYALNYATYEIGMPDDYVDFYFEGLQDGMTMSPNEVYSMAPMVYPSTEWAELLEYSSSSPSVVRVVNNKLLALAPGSATIKVRDPETNKFTTFKVNVLGPEDEGFVRYDKPVADEFQLVGYTTTKAYYQLSGVDKELGDTGAVRFFEGNYFLSMYPSESVQLNYKLEAFFPEATQVVFESSNEKIVKVTEKGEVIAVAEGNASITIKVLMDGKSTFYSQSVTVEVKDPYVATGPILLHYFGNGGTVMIPGDRGLNEIGGFAFSNFDYVDKTPEEYEFDDTTLSKQWFIGDDTITKVIIPEGIKKIGSYAFANLTALEEVVLPSTLESIEYGAFFQCGKLQKITFSGENNIKIISKSAFEGCDLRGTLDLPFAYVIGDYAFAGNANMTGIHLPETLQSIGAYAFAGCSKLADVKVTAERVKYGPYAFTGCESLTSFEVNTSVIPAGMFYKCRALADITIGKDVTAINEYAFRDTAITTYNVADGNTAFKVQNAPYVISADGSTLIAVTPSKRGEYTVADIDNANVTVIGRGAFSHNSKINSVVLENVNKVEAYGFASCERLANVKLGELNVIGEYAFSETAIKEMPRFNTKTEIGKYAFLRSGLVSVRIPDGMTIAEGVFSECPNLETVVIGNDVVIGDYAFFQDKDKTFTVKNYTENGKKFYYYDFATALKNLTIGNNAVIGENAFTSNASLQSVTLGEGAQIGKMAFYGTSSLKKIDLSKALSVGEYAFSGDVYYICQDLDMTVPAVDKDRKYMMSYFAPKLEKVDLSSANSVGAYAFSNARYLKDVVLGESVSEIPEYAFANCALLENINLSKVVTVGDYAFMETVLKDVDLSSAANVGKYAFVNVPTMTVLTLNASATNLDEGAFAYCGKLATVNNLEFAQNIGEYAFAYTAIVNADLTGAVTIGDHAFVKDVKTPFTVKLGENLTTIGDNPFAFCEIKPFGKVEVQNFNGVDYETMVYTYDINDNVLVIDGSLYCKVPNGGLELIVYAGTQHENVQIADGTVRITAMAFAGSDAQMVTLPHTVASLGHKAFFNCEKLKTVVFKSYDAPILEEEYDKAYYDSLQHIPGSGEYGSYVDEHGNEISLEGIGLIPYYMWNATGGTYSNVFYGANFVNYVGYVENKLMMVKPVNGQNYESYMFNQYFDLRVEGPTAADDVTLAAIAAINAIPERVDLEHQSIVAAARAAYNKIATVEQQALVTNYDKLITAEQRIKALMPPEEKPEDETKSTNTAMIVTIVIVCVVAVAGGAAAVVLLNKKQKTAEAKAEEAPAAEEAATTEEAENAEEAEKTTEVTPEAKTDSDTESTNE